MSRDNEVVKMLNRVVNELREHVDTVEVIVTYMDGSTTKMRGGANGNMYARSGAIKVVNQLLDEELSRDGNLADYGLDEEGE